MSGQRHELGFCTCQHHAGRPWNRPEHWTAAEVSYLEGRFGRATDLAIARHLGRSVVGIRLKAKRLGLRKKDAGLTAREVAQLLGVDETIVSKHWIRAGLLHSTRPYRQGPHRIHLVSDRELRRFITECGQYLDADRVPTDSPYFQLAQAHAFVALPEVASRTGHAKPYILRLVADGIIRSARRGPWWYIAREDVALIPSQPVGACAESHWRREMALAARRDRRKGVTSIARRRVA